MRFAILYWIIVNVATFLVFGLDKCKARAGKLRVRERTLFALAIAGGAAGGVLAMCVFRHKIRKPGFAAGLPVLLVVQTVGFFSVLHMDVNIGHILEKMIGRK